MRLRYGMCVEMHAGDELANQPRDQRHAWGQEHCSFIYMGAREKFQTRFQAAREMPVNARPLQRKIQTRVGTYPARTR